MILQSILCSVLSQTCPSDLYEDGQIDLIDSFVILQKWGPCPDSCREDLDGDLTVGMSDLLIVLLAWGPCEDLKENYISQQIGDQTSLIYVAPTSGTPKQVRIQATTPDP
jgi:hypothetical protein